VQVGGRSWHFIFKRKALVETARDTLRRI